MPKLLQALPALLLLLVLAGPFWQPQIDDQFITLNFAWEWVEHGRIAWSTGEVVEGFSSFTQLGLSALAILLGLDINTFVKELALGCGLGVLLLGALRIPQSAALLVALAAWEPLAAWSGLGMEMTLFTLLISAAWMEVVRPTRSFLAPLLFLLAAFTRPEGNGHLWLGLLVRAFLGGLDAWAVLSVGAWAALQGVRIAYFGHVWPTPFLVKVQGLFEPGASALRLGGDLLSAAGLILAWGVAFPQGERRRWLALLPLGIQAALTLGSAVDWMGNGRFLLPGLTAALLSWGVVSKPPQRAAWVLVLGLLGGMVRPETENDRHLRWRSWPEDGLWAYQRAFDTPCFDDLRWMIPDVPAGGDVFTVDVGMPGNIHDLALHDLVGLTDRQIAEWMARPSLEKEIALGKRFQGPGSMRVRLVNWRGGMLGAWPHWLGGDWQGPEIIPFSEGVLGVYRSDQKRASDTLILERWRRLYERYPSQGPLTWAYAQALSRTDLGAAARVADAARAHFPADPVLVALSAALWDGRDLEDWAQGAGAAQQRKGPLGPLSGVALSVEIVPEPPQACPVLVQWDCAKGLSYAVQEARLLPIPPLNCAEHAFLEVSLGVPCQDDQLVVGFRSVQVF